MKRRSYGGGRWKREASDEQPLVKAMKHEGPPEGEDEELEVEEEEESLQQQQDPIPMVFSLLAASQRRNGNKNNLKDPRYSNYHERRDKIFNAQLIQEVSRHPALFDFTTEEYKSIEARNRHWEEVSSRVEQPLEFVRTRWKTLRDRFKKEVRRVQSNQPGIAWQHYEEMLYLLPFVRDKLLEEVPFRGDGQQIEQQHQHNKQRAAKGTARGQVVDEHLAVVQQQQMNSCTAAILDLAMSAVNSRYSPPPPSSSRRSTSPASTNTNNESALHDHFGTNGGGTEYAGGTSSSAGGGATAFINSGTRLRTFPSTEQAQQNGGAQRKQSSNNNNKGAAEWMAENGGGADEEDQLFCRIVLKKLGRLEERVKEKAKAKIMEMLVEMQYGEANKKSG